MDRRTLLKNGLAAMGALLASQRVHALNAHAPSKKTWAVVYGTQCGSSRDAANWINDGLGGIADIIEVTAAPSVADYEWFIIGGPIQAGRLINPVSNFVTSNKAALRTKIMGLFTLCGNSGNANFSSSTIKNYLTDQIVQLSDVTDKPAKLFPGRSTPSCGGMTYDNLKKTDCEAFGRSIAATAIDTMPGSGNHRLTLGRVRTAPFAAATVISFTLPEASRVRLTVHGLDGTPVATVVSGFRKAGVNAVWWDHRAFPPGYYLLRLQSDGGCVTRSFALPGA